MASRLNFCNVLQGLIFLNILFWLTPKSEVDYIIDDASLNKALQKMENRNFSAVPVISRTGKYVGTLTASDILGCIKENFDLSMKKSADFPVSRVRRVRDNKPVYINARMEDMLDIIQTQNFVPVVDDENNFIGIITRSQVIKWMRQQLTEAYSDNDDILK